MSPKYWETSGDLSSDSSAESSQDELREDSPAGSGPGTGADGAIPWHLQEETEPGENSSSAQDGESSSVEIPQDPNTGALSRVMSTNFQLPTLQPHQHASLFYLSLIEGRCRTQAVNSINATRRQEDRLLEDHPEVCELAEHLFTEMSKELVKAGMMPEEFVGRPLPELRMYLRSFDSLLSTIARKKSQDLSQNNLFRTIGSTNYISLPGIGPSSAHDASQALIRQDNSPFSMAPLDGQTPLISSLSPLLTLLSPKGRRNNAPSIPASIWATEYAQLSSLGKGGFGHVYKAQYIMDGTEYAVKRIFIPADRIQHHLGTRRMNELWSEVAVLSKLDHRHIVRYHHCWCEAHPAGTLSASTGEDSSGTLSLDESQVDHGVSSFRIGIEREFNNEMRKIRRNSTTHEAGPDMVIFERSVSSKSKTTGVANSGIISKTNTSKSEKLGFFRSSNESDSSDDADGEDDEDERTESTVEFPLTNTAAKVPKVDFDMILYIKMSAYPLTLQDYLSPEGDKLDLGIRHCFHILPTIRLFLSVLAGVEYLHRKNIIHRDLKPGNIFLSILEDTEPATEGYININSCNECKKDKSKTAKPIHLIPRIGDFGLADLKELKSSGTGTPAPSPTQSSTGQAVNDSYRYPFSTTNTATATGASHQAAVGTRFYVPPTSQRNKPVICPKLDIYSLGIIAFELAYKMETRAERGHVMEELRRGKFPRGFEEGSSSGGSELVEGIKGMLCHERESRWDCEMVRSWLVELEASLVGSG